MEHFLKFVKNVDHLVGVLRVLLDNFNGAPVELGRIAFPLGERFAAQVSKDLSPLSLERSSDGPTISLPGQNGKTTDSSFLSSAHLCDLRLSVRGH